VATPIVVARLGASAADASFVATASFAAQRVDGALPYLIDVVHHVGLAPDIAADVVLVVYEEMRTTAALPGTRDVGVKVEMRQDALSVKVHRSRSAAPGALESVSTWLIPTSPSEGHLTSIPDLDRSALVAGLSSASASAYSASIASLDRRSASIEVLVGPEAPANVRRRLARALQANGVEEDVQDDVQLMVSELVSNVIRHENSPTIRVVVAVDGGGAVTVTVTGASAVPSAALVHPAGPPPTSSVSGRGLGVVDSLSSVWGTRRQDGMTSVWFTVRNVEAPTGADTPGLPGPARATVAGSDPTFAEHTSAPGRKHLSAAAEVIAEAVAIAAATEAQLTAEPEVVAVRAAFTAEQAAVQAAATTAEAARNARTARAMAASLAAQNVAEAAARTVEAIQIQADELAAAVAGAASEAAATVARSIAPGGDAEAARAALRVGAAVFSAAAVKAEETARAAVLVARTVASTAAAVAATTAAAADAMDNEVLDAAVAVRAVAAATAQQLAADTVERGAAVALAGREAAAASETLHEANRQLRRDGSHDRAVALALQEAMLTHLPESGNLQLAARYLTAAEQDQVGGDWYDALVLPTGSTTLVIGDVIGHDIAAAAVMGQLRNLLRALVWDRDEPPSAVAVRLDRAMRDLRIDTIASLILVSVEPTSPGEDGDLCTLRWTNAGHPAPILIHADGTAISLDETTDLLLGVKPDVVRRDHTHRVPLGATLLLYTDGLVETRTEGIDVGQERLRSAARTHHRLEPGDFVDAVIAEMVGDRPADDVAVLAVRFQGTQVAAG
jgi:serine phosphatase RsbU (regulator of sigma subunit)/anti-sigma regulatory factor (Ser/Thr protein kinase)